MFTKLKQYHICILEVKAFLTLLSDDLLRTLVMIYPCSVSIYNFHIIWNKPDPTPTYAIV